MTTTVLTDVLAIEVRASGEYGLFLLREGRNASSRTGHEPYYWCQLTINSGYGTVSHYWGAMAHPAARFLAGCDRGYLIGKLWGAESRVFCAREAIKDLRELVRQKRLDTYLNKEDARAAYDELDELPLTDDATEFWTAVQDSTTLGDIFNDPCNWPDGKIENPAATGLFKTLWPEFLQALAAAREPVESAA